MGAERDCVLALSLMRGIGSRRLAALVAHFGSAARAWEAPCEELEACPGLPKSVAERLAKTRRAVDPSEFSAGLARKGLRTVTVLDADYPPGLRSLADCPPVLYVRGDAACLAAPGVAVVGTRKPTPYGLETTGRLAAGLAAAGLSIISGLAVGIDTAAHRAALEAGGVTVAVLGSGHDRLYPERNAGLAAEIARHGGAVISQFPPDTLPLGRNFVARNRVVAGLGLAVLVTEAPEESGALITAGFARLFGRPVMTVPGPVSSPASGGCLGLLREGARAVGSAADVVADLGFAVAPADGSAAAPAAGRATGSAAAPAAGRASGPPRETGPRVEGDAARVLDCLTPGEVVPFALLLARTGLGADRLGTLLGLLEVKGLVSRQPGEHYSRV